MFLLVRGRKGHAREKWGGNSGKMDLGTRVHVQKS
jgi:hypothetical protein